MGANILNMGLLTAAIGYGLYRSTLGRSQSTKLTVAGIAAWLSVMAGALSTSLQLWLSGTAQLQIVIPAMLGVHAFIGLGEAAVTVAALAFIFQTRPDLLNESPQTAKGGRGWVLVGAVISLAVVLLAPFASANPDGLNRVAIDLGFMQSAQTRFGPLAGYAIHMLDSNSLSKILAGTIGVIAVGAIIILIGRSLQVRKSHPERSKEQREEHSRRAVGSNRSV
jgi:cobalt/nickel transport system permease protein